MVHMVDEPVPWDTCGHDGCKGSRVADTAWCLAHAAEQAREAFDAELKRIGAEGTVDARGVVISASLLQQLLDAAPRKEDKLVLTAARFDHATFEGPAWFKGVTFQGKASFDQVTFERNATFNEATFKGWAWFSKATFKGAASFEQAIFESEAWFAEATVHGQAWFRKARFEGEAVFQATFEGQAWFAEAAFAGPAFFINATFKDLTFFGKATFKDKADFGNATFEGLTTFSEVAFQDEAGFFQVNFQDEAEFDRASFQTRAGFLSARFQGRAQFRGATFIGQSRFSYATFEGEARFDQATFRSPAYSDRTTFKREVAYNGATFHNVATFNGAVFEQARQFGPLLVAWRLELNDVVFHTWVRLEVAAASLRMGRTQFVGGAQIRVRWASVVLDDASLAASSLLAGVPPFKGLDERPFTQRWARRPPVRPPAEQWRPRLLTLVRTDVAGLRIANVDLRACRFVEAHNLDKLRIEGTPQLAPSPLGWHLRRVGGEGLPIWRWTSRMTLAEEQQWRATRPLRRTASGRHHPQLRGWYPQACRPDPELQERSGRSPVQLAALYRELRKGREDAKDEPGAADFYYGEMELRRHNPDTPLGERFVLWLYWLTSGYSLRGLRALICLAGIVFALAGLLHTVGFLPLHPITPRSFWGSLLYAAESTLSLGTSDVRLTGWGRALRIVLRLTGPVLLGLALLSVRNRVKR
jgi:uncharacterized protein YjbI with pentapeptide repeats